MNNNLFGRNMNNVLLLIFLNNDLLFKRNSNIEIIQIFEFVNHKRSTQKMHLD